MNLYRAFENRTVFAEPEKRRLPTTLVTGWLGSGKTTVMRHVLANRQDLRVACAVNDFAQLNIDAELVAREDTGARTPGADEGVVELTNGCLCCTLGGELETEVWRMLDAGARREADGTGAVDYLLIETSGLVDPTETVAALDKTFGKLARVRLDSVVCVVDAESAALGGVGSAPVGPDASGSDAAAEAWGAPALRRRRRPPQQDRPPWRRRRRRKRRSERKPLDARPRRRLGTRVETVAPDARARVRSPLGARREDRRVRPGRGAASRDPRRRARAAARGQGRPRLGLRRAPVPPLPHGRRPPKERRRELDEGGSVHHRPRRASLVAPAPNVGRHLGRVRLGVPPRRIRVARRVPALGQARHPTGVARAKGFVTFAEDPDVTYDFHLSGRRRVEIAERVARRGRSGRARGAARRDARRRRRRRGRRSPRPKKGTRPPEGRKRRGSCSSARAWTLTPRPPRFARSRWRGTTWGPSRGGTRRRRRRGGGAIASGRRRWWRRTLGWNWRRRRTSGARGARRRRACTSGSRALGRTG